MLYPVVVAAVPFFFLQTISQTLSGSRFGAATPPSGSCPFHTMPANCCRTCCKSRFTLRQVFGVLLLLLQLLLLLLLPHCCSRQSEFAILGNGRVFEKTLNTPHSLYIHMYMPTRIQGIYTILVLNADSPYIYIYIHKYIWRICLHFVCCHQLNLCKPIDSFGWGLIKFFGFLSAI